MGNASLPIHELATLLKQREELREVVVIFAGHDEACTAEANEMYDTSACRVCRVLKDTEDVPGG